MSTAPLSGRVGAIGVCQGLGPPPPDGVQLFGYRQNDIHVNGHQALINELLENVIHHGLEGGWAVGEAKVHDQWFEESPVCPEGSFPLVTLFDTYIVISQHMSSFMK